MFDENAFSLDSFDQGSWLFLLEINYLELSGHQRIYVRSVIESVCTKEESDRAIACAAANALSTMDSIVASRIDISPLLMVETNEQQIRRRPKAEAIKQQHQSSVHVVLKEHRSIAIAANETITIRI